MSAANATKTRKPGEKKLKKKERAECAFFKMWFVPNEDSLPSSFVFASVALKHAHSHKKRMLSILPIKDYNLVSKIWSCTKTGLISSLLLVGDALVLPSQENKILFYIVTTKNWRKKWRKKQTKQKDLSVKMGDLPAYSCYAEMTSRPTMKTRHRSYHMSHHILVDWSSSLPLCYRLLRIRRMEKRDDRFHNRKKQTNTTNKIN